MAGSSVFVGRKQELAELDRALSAALDGRGELVVIAGEPGIGKTTLCTSFAEQARRRGVRALWGRAWEFGGAPPFWPWVQVLRALEGEAADEGAARSLLGGLAGPAGAAAPFAQSGASDRFALFDAVTERLRAAAAAAPIAILLEDLHAADLPSLLLLRFAVEQLRDARVIVVGTRRTVEASVGPDAVALIAELSRVARALDLHGLATAELVELVAHHAPDRAPEFALALHDRTSGNPLLAAALLQPGSQTETDDRVPLRARAAIEQRVLRLPAPVREVLSAAAVIGREVATLLLARVCDRPLDQVLEHVRVLIAEQVLVERVGTPGRYGFRHGLFREVVYAALSPGERLRLHRAAGHALEALYGEQRDAHLPELARHFLAVYPDAERGVDYAAGAAAQALRALAYEDAAEHYGQALAAVDSAGPSQGRTCALWIGLAEAQAASGQRAQARESYRTAHRIAIDGGEHALQARAAIGFARMAGFGRSDDEALSWLERALEVTRDPATRVRVLAALIDRLWAYPGASGRVEALADDMLALAQSSGDQRLQAEALAATLVMSWVPDPQRFVQHYARSAELLALAEALGDLDLRVEAHRWRFTACMIHGDVAEAKRVLSGYERLAERTARPQLRFNALMRRQMLALMEGRFDDARQLLPDLERAGRRAGDDQAEYLVANFRFQLCRAFGDKPGLRQVFEHFREVVRNDMPALIVTAIAAASHALVGDRAEACRAIDAYLELASTVQAGAPMAMASAAIACWQLGDGERARTLRPRLAPSEDLVLMGGVVDFYGPGALYLGLLAATAGEYAQAERDLDKAVAVLDRIGARYHAAVARNALAQVVAQRAPERAAALREQAHAVAVELGGVSLLDPVLPAASSVTSSPPAATLPRAVVAEAVFYAEGEYYTIGLGDSVVRVRCSKGLALIERLLRGEGTELHVLELADAALDDRGGDGPLLDQRAKAAYRARAEALRDELAEAERFGDAGRSLRAREELDTLAEQLAQATGLHGRDRPGGTAERARARVTLAIRRAIKGLERVHPTLAAHLDAAIATGTFCVYRPEPRARVTWRFEPPVAS